MTDQPRILTAEQIRWVRERSAQKDSLHLEVIDWKAVLASHEAQRAQIAALLTALAEFRLYTHSLRGRTEDITQHTVDLALAEFDRKVLREAARLGLGGEAEKVKAGPADER